MLTLVLVGGIAWYERSRPSARMIALVAALAAVADGGVGACRPRRGVARDRERTATRATRARLRMRARRLRLRRPARLLRDGRLRRRAVARPLPGALGSRPSLQRRPRRRQLRARLCRRPGDGADDL